MHRSIKNWVVPPWNKYYVQRLDCRVAVRWCWSHVFLSCTHHYVTCFICLHVDMVSLYHHLTFVPADTASNRGLTMYYLIVCVHLSDHTPIIWTKPLPSVHHSIQFAPSENTGGCWEREENRKKWGEMSPNPTPESLLYLQCTHLKARSLHACVCCSRNTDSVPSGQRKNDLFNAVREHLTLNLCETNSREKRRMVTKS